MYEKRKVKNIIAHFDVVPLEMGLFDHVFDFFKQHFKFLCRWDKSNNNKGVLFVFTTRLSLDISLG